MTQQQDVVAAKAKISTLKDEYLASLQAYLGLASKSGPEAKAAALECQRRGTAYFNYAEEFVGNSDLLGAHKSDLWAQGFAEDCSEILNSLPAHFEFLEAAFQRLPELRGLRTRPGPAAYANMQRMVVMYLDDALVKSLRAGLATKNIPVYGFDNKATSPPNKQRNTVVALTIGVVAIALVLVLALIFPEPSKFQRAVFWTVLALGVGGVASVMSGFIELKLGKWLLAGGGLAVFVLVYFWAPVDPNQPTAPAVAPVPATAASK